MPYSNDALYEQFRNTQIPNSVPMKGPKHPMVRYFQNYLTTLGCSAIVVESKYVDGDFLDDFAHYYVRCFRPYERFCKRLHFFKKFDSKAFYDYLRGGKLVNDLQTDAQENYLGFIVIKPLPESVIGRTVLLPWPGTIENGEDIPESRSFRCNRPYDVNLAGIRLRLASLAFQEQDTVIAACATSALWAAFQRTTFLFGYRQPSLFEITNHATRYFQVSRSIPSEGLTISQMAQAVREIGLEAELRAICFPKTDQEWEFRYPLLAASYAYLRGGLPVVLAVRVRGVGDHAVALNGYRLGDNGPGFDEMKILDGPKLSLRGSRIVSLYAHDDQIGPYSKLVVERGGSHEDEPTYPIELKSSWTREDGSETTLIPLSMITPVYHKIRVPFTSVIKLADRLDGFLEPAFPGIEREWDIFLTSVKDYKTEIGARSDIHGPTRARLLDMPHARFLWRVRAFVRGKEVIELLADATDMERSFQGYALNLLDRDLASKFAKVTEALRSKGITSDPRQLDYDPLIPHLADLIWEYSHTADEANLATP